MDSGGSVASVVESDSVNLQKTMLHVVAQYIAKCIICKKMRELCKTLNQLKSARHDAKLHKPLGALHGKRAKGNIYIRVDLQHESSPIDISFPCAKHATAAEVRLLLDVLLVFLQQR